MSHISFRAAAFLSAALLLTTSFAGDAEAQSRSSYSAWRTYYRNSSEGQIDEREEERGTSRRGYSSATQRAINDLDDDEVEEMPIPILLGFTLGQLTPNFGDPRDGGARSHEGLDMLAAKGSYIVSPTEAVVTRVGTGSSAGKYVYTANPGGETFAYMHLDDFADNLKSGTKLKKGDLIGYVGNTGNASGGPTHLHFEIRDGREATDPYPRLTEEFTLKERMAAIKEILNDADDEEEEAESLVASYRGIFIAARAQGIELPDEIEDLLGTAVATPAASGFARDLTLGSSGQDVTALQAYLIAEDIGPKADALASTGATGYFGAVTQAALIEFQIAKGISPSSGYFGPLTRSRIAAGA